MSRRERTESVGDSMCSVCHDKMDIYAIGVCDHPICYRCSTRMRVLCSQMYCPICRGDLPQVVFLTEKKKYESVDRRKCIPNRQYKILFENEDVEEAYDVLLENRCRVCDKGPLFDTFQQLETHMKRSHSVFACDLCVSHLKIFPFERKFYSRKDLAMHRRSGDPDNTSYRGHPICRFCDDRYMDSDELLRHLRKDHFYCQFCDALNSNEYYNDYEDLKAHFRAKHFLCEEGVCASPNARFIHAFNSEIDLKAHKTSDHMGKRSKAEAKELRTIDLHFQVAPRRRGRDNSVITSEDFEEVNASGGRTQRHGAGYKRAEMHHDVRERPENKQASRESSVGNNGIRPPPCMPILEEDFPSLSNTPPVPVYQPPIKERAEPQEDFPSLLAQKHSSPVGALTSMPSRPVQKKPTPHVTSNAVGNFSHMGATVTGCAEPTQPSRLGEGRPVVSKQASSAKIGSGQKWSAPLFSSGEEFPTLGVERKEKSVINGPHFVNLGAWSKTQKDGSKKDASKAASTMASFKQASENSGFRPLSASFSKGLGDDREFPLLGGVPTLKTITAVWGEDKLHMGDKKKPASLGSTLSLPKKQVNGTKDSGSTDPKSKKKKKKQKAKSDTGESVVENGVKADSLIEEVQVRVSEQVSEETCHSTTECESSPQQNLEVNLKQSNDYIYNSLPCQPQESNFTSAETPVVPTAVENLNILEDKENQEIFSSPEIFVDDEFPSLQSISKKTDPPPGFIKTQKVTKPPPGLKKPLSQARAPPGLASSLGSSSACIPMSVKLNMHLFVPPIDIAERNNELVMQVRQMLKATDLDKFRKLSGDFRSGQISAMEYLQQCQDLLGKENFCSVLPELVALLPDILKQQELLVACKHPSIALELHPHLLSCPVCYQLLTVKDLTPHMVSHHSFGTSDHPSASVPQSVPSKITLAS